MVKRTHIWGDSCAGHHGKYYLWFIVFDPLNKPTCLMLLLSHFKD